MERPCGVLHYDHVWGSPHGRLVGLREVNVHGVLDERDRPMPVHFESRLNQDWGRSCGVPDVALGRRIPACFLAGGDAD
jgi:hypothetical protein